MVQIQFPDGAVRSYEKGITALGISSGLGDYAKFMQSPLSAFSITSFVFGVIGTITTEVMSRISKKW